MTLLSASTYKIDLKFLRGSGQVRSDLYNVICLESSTSSMDSLCCCQYYTLPSAYQAAVTFTMRFIIIFSVYNVIK